MKAAVYKQYGTPEVVKLEEVDKPTPKSNEVLVKVCATTVNSTDCGFRSAEYFISRIFSGLFKPKFRILGNEFAGVIETVGKEVTILNINDKVFGYNDTKFGAHAEYMTIAETDAITIMPDGVTFEQAAPITEGAHYALCDIRASKIKDGDNVMIYGASYKPLVDRSYTLDKIVDAYKYVETRQKVGNVVITLT